MDRAAYDRYTASFNARDYDAVFDFYEDAPKLAFFGVEIGTREALKRFYGFLHQYVREIVTVERFAASDELTAVEGIVRVEGIRIWMRRRWPRTAIRSCSRSRPERCRSCASISIITCGMGRSPAWDARWPDRPRVRPHE